MRVPLINSPALIRAIQTVAVAAVFLLMVGATDSNSRYTTLNHQLMCTCSCAELLGECNHVGCPMSGQELDELHKDIVSGSTDQQILTLFATRYGATVLAAPTMHGFDLVAWIAPVAVFAAALLGTILLIRRWRESTSPTTAPFPPSNETLRDQIRRDTGGYGGY